MNACVGRLTVELILTDAGTAHYPSIPYFEQQYRPPHSFWTIGYFGFSAVNSSANREVHCVGSRYDDYHRPVIKHQVWLGT